MHFIDTGGQEALQLAYEPVCNETVKRHEGTTPIVFAAAARPGLPADRTRVAGKRRLSFKRYPLSCHIFIKKLKVFLQLQENVLICGLSEYIYPRQPYGRE